MLLYFLDTLGKDPLGSNPMESNKKNQKGK